MNKRFILVAVIVLLMGVATFSIYLGKTNRDVVTAPFTAKELFGDKVPQPEIPRALPPLDPNQSVRLAIGWLGLPDENHNRQVADLMVAELSSARNLELVDRQSLDAALREAELGLSGVVRAATAVRVGKLLKADWFLLGTTAGINDRKAALVRIVDARTGVMREVAVIPGGESAPRLAEKLAEFVRQVRASASGGRPRQYLAIGAFVDRSVNARLADFPARLRSYLTAAYAGSDISVLEREYVEVLFQEMRLDIAGLTDGGGTTIPSPLQSGFWMINGEFQSYETTNLDVELSFDILRMLGGGTNRFVRSAPGETLFKSIKSALDQEIRNLAPGPVTSRINEERAQMSTGTTLAGDFDFRFLAATDYTDDSQETRRRREKLEQAIRAFQTVLLLDPTNREAKMYIAGCLHRRPINEIGASRMYYREVLAEPVTDKWTPLAMELVKSSFNWSDTGAKAGWFATAAATTANPAVREFYLREARSAGRDVAIQSGGGSVVQELAEQRLFERIHAVQADGLYWPDMGIGEYVASFGPDREAAAKRLDELLPRIKADATNFVPNTLAALVLAQVDTNSPVITEFEHALESCANDPVGNPAFNRGGFWSRMYYVYEWSRTNNMPALSARVLEAKLRAGSVDPDILAGSEDETKISLAYTYAALQRWKEALAIYESYTNRPVTIWSIGPWGQPPKLIRTGQSANFCRKKLGIPVVTDSREFEMEDTGWCFCTPAGTVNGVQQYANPTGTFATGDRGIWVVHGDELTSMDFALRTNLVVKLPIQPGTPVNCVDVGPADIWIGAGGAGLIQVDKASQQCRAFTEKDGLMMNEVASLCRVGGVLWIGYGGKSSGGLGLFDLSTGQIISFTPSLRSGAAEGEMPVQSRVSSLAPGLNGDVWMVPGPVLTKYNHREKIWNSNHRFQHSTSVAANDHELFIGEGIGGIGKGNGGLGVDVMDLGSGTWRSVPGVDYLPAGEVTSLAIDGSNVWVGGNGYLALVDPARSQVLKVAYLTVPDVRKVEIGGGYVWAQIGWRLYRAAIH